MDLRRTILPVSYTHLDVYKRQIRDHPNRNGSFENPPQNQCWFKLCHIVVFSNHLNQFIASNEGQSVSITPRLERQDIAAHAQSNGKHGGTQPPGYLHIKTQTTKLWLPECGYYNNVCLYDDPAMPAPVSYTHLDVYKRQRQQ